MSLNNNLAEMERVREAYWRRYARTAPVKLRWRAIAVRHCFHVLPGESILEVGAGSGLWTAHLSEVLRGECPITAVTFQSELAGQCRARSIPNVTVAEVRDLAQDLKGRQFDYIVGTGILRREECARDLGVLYQLLKPGGQILFFEANSGKSRLRKAARGQGFTAIEVLPFDILPPRTPRRLIPWIQGAAFVAERAPVIRELCGTLLLWAKRPGERAIAIGDGALAVHRELFGSISVVVPCRNEAMNIEPLAAALLKFYGPYIHEIVIVNDNSSDDTGGVARRMAAREPRVRLVDRMPPAGVGRALGDGYAAATGRYILTMDADFLPIVPELRDLFDAIAAGHDGAIGSRFSRDSVLIHYPFFKILSNRAFHLLVRLLVAPRARDISNNLKIYRAPVLQQIGLDSPHFAANVETGLKPLLQGYDVVEVPVSWIGRTDGMGKSSFHVARVAPDYFRTLVRIVWGAWRKKPDGQADGALERAAFALHRGPCRDGAEGAGAGLRRGGGAGSWIGRTDGVGKSSFHRARVAPDYFRTLVRIVWSAWRKKPAGRAEGALERADLALPRSPCRDGAERAGPGLRRGGGAGLWIGRTDGMGKSSFHVARVAPDYFMTLVRIVWSAWRKKRGGQADGSLERADLALPRGPCRDGAEGAGAGLRRGGGAGSWIGRTDGMGKSSFRRARVAPDYFRTLVRMVWGAWAKKPAGRAEGALERADLALPRSPCRDGAERAGPGLRRGGGAGSWIGRTDGMGKSSFHRARVAPDYFRTLVRIVWGGWRKKPDGQADGALERAAFALHRGPCRDEAEAAGPDNVGGAATTVRAGQRVNSPARCPVCGSERTRLYLEGREGALKGEAFGSSRTAVSVGDVLRCRECGFGFSRIRGDGNQLAALYREMDTALYEAEAAGRTKTAHRHFEILAREWGGTPGRLLEIGCASGRFLKFAGEAGWECVGVEPSAALAAEARRMVGSRATVIESTFEAAGLAGATFDAVAMFDVLEHVPEPVEFLRRAAERMSPDGVLLMNVPDLDSIQAQVLGRRWPLLLPEHLNYFNRGSLRLAAEAAGLRLVRQGRRPAWFSAGYVLYRLAQHGIPGAGWLRWGCGTVAGRVVLPVWMGEFWSVFRNRG